MKTLVILNCVDDAKHFILNAGHGKVDRSLISTHESVNDYLGNKGIECGHLLDHVGYEKIAEITVKTEALVNDILEGLDIRFSQSLNDILQTDIRWFYAKYRYVGKFEYVGLWKLYEALKNLLAKELFEKIAVYDSVETSFFENKNTLYYTARLLCRNVSLIKNRKNIKNYYISGKKYKNGAVKMFLRKLRPIVSPLLNEIKSALDGPAAHAGVKDIFLFPPLYDLDFLRAELRGRALIIDPDSRAFRMRLSRDEEFKINKTILLTKKTEPEKAGLESVFLDIILTDFCGSIKSDLSAVKWLDSYRQKNGIRLAVWGNPPDWKKKALMTEYLLRKNIPVVGAQHGGGYCELDMAWNHFDSDFNWCSHFLSYGFDEEDIKDAYPSRRGKCRIVPMGHISAVKKVRKKRETIDLLFPMTNSLLSSLESIRVKNSDLARNQRDLLKFLNNYYNKRIVIKPVSLSDDKTNAAMYLLRGLKNLEVIADLSINDTVERFNIKSFLIDYPSTSLMEAVLGALDGEIFVLSNNCFKYTTFFPKIRSAAEKRVHIFDDTKALQGAVDLFFNGSLEKKRDTSYQSRYYEKSNSKDIVRSLIKSIHERDGLY